MEASSWPYLDHLFFIALSKIKMEFLSQPFVNKKLEKSYLCLEQFPHLHCEKDCPTVFIKKTKPSPDLETPDPRFH